MLDIFLFMNQILQPLLLGTVEHEKKWKMYKQRQRGNQRKGRGGGEVKEEPFAPAPRERRHPGRQIDFLNFCSSHLPSPPTA